MATTAALTLEEIRKGLAWRKQLDKVFVLVGLAVLFGCLATLAILFADLLQQGSSRFGWDFFTSFPSRKAERAGILSAAVGTSLIMVVTALVALPSVSRPPSTSRSTRRRTGSRDHRDQRDQPRRRALDRVRPAGARVVRVPVQPGPEHPRGGPHAGAADLPIVIVATRESLRAVPKAIREAAYGLGARAGRSPRTRAAVLDGRHFDRPDPRPFACDR